MKPVWLFLGLILAVFSASCGDGENHAGVFPPTPTQRATPVKSDPNAGPQLVLPCTADQYVQIKPNLTYEVKVTDDPDGLQGFVGVLMDACMGQPFPTNKTAVETLGKGVQHWLMEAYPRGATEKSQTELEAKVCQEVARLIASDPVLSKVTWVSLATTGTWQLPLKPAKITSGEYTPPGCKLPTKGPTA